MIKRLYEITNEITTLEHIAPHDMKLKIVVFWKALALKLDRDQTANFGLRDPHMRDTVVV